MSTECSKENSPLGHQKYFQQAECFDLITASRKSVRHRQRPQEQTAWAWAGAGAAFGRHGTARAAQEQLCWGHPAQKMLEVVLVVTVRGLAWLSSEEEAGLCRSAWEQRTGP